MDETSSPRVVCVFSLVHSCNSGFQLVDQKCASACVMQLYYKFYWWKTEGNRSKRYLQNRKKGQIGIQMKNEILVAERRNMGK